MRLAYIDEAGISHKSQEPFLVVAGVIIHADRDLVAIERHLDRLVIRHIPERHRNEFVFHATELFNGGGKVFRQNDAELPFAKRLEIADDLAAIPRRFNLTIAVGFVDKDKFPRGNVPEFSSMSVHEQTLSMHGVAFVNCAMHIEHWMREHASSEVCLLIVEDNQNARKLILYTQRFHQNNDISILLNNDERMHFPYKKIKEDPLFQQKRKSSVLQVADFCAYVFKRFLMNQKDTRYLRFFDPMRGQFAFMSDEREAKLRAKSRL